MEHSFYTGTEEVIHERVLDAVVIGGLSVCKVCGNFEGGLTTHCPGEEATEKAEDIYARNIDFIDGNWVPVAAAGEDDYTDSERDEESFSPAP